MTSSKSSSVGALLPGALGLVLGLAAGFGLSSLLGGRGGEVRAQAGDALPRPATPAEPTASAGRELTAPSRTTSGRVRAAAPVEVVAAEPAATPESEEVEDPADVPLDLMAELTAFLRSGQVEASLSSRPDRVSRYLALQYMGQDRAIDALALLRRHPSKDGSLYERLGRALRKDGDLEAAREAYLEALERDPFDDDRIEALRELDPAGALAVLEAKQAELGFLGGGPIGMQRAALLAALGREDEASQAALDALSGDLVDDESWELFGEIDPAAAEAALRERSAAEESGAALERLAALIGSDPARTQEAVRILEGLLARGAGSSNAWAQLLEVDADRMLVLLGERDAGEVEPWVLGRAGDHLIAVGRTADAVEAWAESFARGPTDSDAAARLLEHAPERLWAQCAESSRSSRDDEVLGDIADLYWEHGRKDEAIQLWRRANGIDPQDGEWTDKLRKAALGR